MHESRRTAAGLTLAALTWFHGATAAADEQKIMVDDLPKPVTAAARKAFPEAKLVGAVREKEDDDVLYVVELTLDGKAVELAVDPDGTIEAVEREIDVDDLPKAVTRAAAKRFPNGKIAKVEEVSDSDDDVVYELDITDNGKKVEVVMSPNGKILDIDEEGDDKDDKSKDDDKKEKQDKDKDGKKKDKDGKKSEKKGDKDNG